MLAAALNRAISTTTTTPLLLVIALCLVFSLSCSRSQDLSRAYHYVSEFQSCDWSGSGLDERGIRPVYLRCTQGEVQWKYPKGALRIVFRYASKNIDFQICIKANEGFRGARIYREKHHDLQLLFAVGDGRPLLLSRCFESSNSEAILYVEADLMNQTASAQTAGWRYQLRGLSADLHELNDCRPCSEEELLRAYCTSDFVVRGRIANLFNNPSFDRTEILVAATKVHRQTSPVFVQNSAFPPPPFASLLSRRQQQQQPASKNPAAGVYGTVYFPLRCKVKPDPEEFVFMGTLRLGDPMVQCALPKLQWVRLKRRAMSGGQAHCVLEL